MVKLQSDVCATQRLLIITMIQGKDIGKIKKEGYLWGTQAFRWRSAFVAVMLTWTCGYGYYKL